MKVNHEKNISFVLILLVMCVITVPVNANTQDFNLKSEAELYLDELIELFPEANLNKEILLRKNDQSDIQGKKSIIGSYVKNVDNTKYELVKLMIIL